MKSRDSVFSIFFMRAFTFALMAVGLAGCGSGGSSGGGSPAPTVVISTANAPAVAGAAISAAVGAASTPLGAVTTTTSHSATIAPEMQLINSAITAAIKAMNQQNQAPAIASGTIYNYGCLVSGSYSINATNASSATLSYSNCSDIAGETMNGTISMSNVVSTVSSMSANIVLNLTMTMASPAETVTIIGDISYTQTATTLHMSGNSLTYTSTIYGTRSMVNYSFDEDLTTGAITESFSCNSTAMGGVATVTITTAFTYGSGIYPNGGVATVTGASNTKLRITILGDETAPSGSQVKLEVSTDGGSTYGTPIYVDWSTLNI